jgi:hypothetical protein
VYLVLIALAVTVRIKGFPTVHIVIICEFAEYLRYRKIKELQRVNRRYEHFLQESSLRTYHGRP